DDEDDRGRPGEQPRRHRQAREAGDAVGTRELGPDRLERQQPGGERAHGPHDKAAAPAVFATTAASGELAPEGTLLRPHRNLPRSDRRDTAPNPGRGLDAG